MSVPTTTVPKKACLPFKRVLQTSPEKVQDDDDQEDSLSLFRRSNEVFPDVIRDREERIREKEQEKEKTRRSASVRDASADLVGKRRKFSHDTTSDESDVGPMCRSGSVKRQAAMPSCRQTHALTHDRRHSTPRSCSSIAKQKSLFVKSALNADLIVDMKGKCKENLSPSRTPRSGRQERVPIAEFLNGSAPSSAHRRSVTGSHGESIRPLSSVPINVEDDSDDGANEDDLVYEKRHRMFSDDDPTRESIDAAPEPPEVEPADEFARFIVKARERRAAEKERQALGGGNDPVVNIMLESTLPDTEPMTVKRRLSQTMEVLLKTWIAKNRPDVPVDVAARFFLTWKGIKIFDATTLESLGVETDADGHVRLPRSFGQSEAAGYVRNGILFEVHDDHSYKAYLDQRNKKTHNTTTGEDDDDDDIAVVQEATPAPKKTVTIILRAKDLAPLKVNVDRRAPIQNLMDAFRRKHGIPEEKRVALSFDGEDLMPEAEVNDYDVEMDETNQFEVYIK